jgi:hypothetical protein
VKTRLLLTVRVEVEVEDEERLVAALAQRPKAPLSRRRDLRPAWAVTRLLDTGAITEAIRGIPGVRPIGGEVSVVPDHGDDHPWGPELPGSVGWFKNTGEQRPS